MGDEAGRKRWPLIYAAGENDITEVRKLIDQGADINEISKDGESVLHVAAIKGGSATTLALLKAGANPNARTPPGSTMSMTPLMWTTYHGHTEMAAMLLEAGADPLAVDENGKDLLTMSREAAKPDIEKLLQQKIAKLDGKTQHDEI